MKEIRTAAVLGAGALGAYFIWGLSDKLGDGLWVIADGERKARLERDGLVINGRHCALNVKTPEQARGVDLLLVATKFQALEGALDDIEKIADDDTIVMSLLNGVTSEDMIAERIGGEHLIYCTMRIASERDGNRVGFDAEWTPGLFYGEKADGRSEKLDALERLLEGTGIHYTHCADIMHEIWEKFALNISKNLPQAILGVGVGAYQDSEYAASMGEALRQEVVAVAARCGVDLTWQSEATKKKSVAAKWARYSTLQDLDAGRHTEIDAFSGTLVELGKKYGVPTPCNQFVYWTIKALEEKNDGRFVYKK